MTVTRQIVLVGLLDGQHDIPDNEWKIAKI